MDYCYNDLVRACNKTRIYPHGCCPNEFECCSCHNKDKKCGCGCGCECDDNICTRDDDGVNRVNFCPCGTNKCHCHHKDD